MRVLLDANIYISYLLASTSEGIIDKIIKQALSYKFILLVPDPLLEEFIRKIGHKRYLRQRIDPTDLKNFVRLLKSVSEVMPKITEPIPTVVRDRKDDYLLAYALVEQADYLVTGDRDLLTLKRVENITIVTPRKFLDILKKIHET